MSAKTWRSPLVCALIGAVALTPLPAFSRADAPMKANGRLVGALIVERGSDVADEDIFLLGTNGERNVNITNAAFRQNSPSWSPDGRWIAYTSNSGLFVTSPDGTRQRVVAASRFVDNDSWIARAGTTWAPDGTRLATIEWTMTAEGPPSSVSLVTYRVEGGGRRVEYTTEASLFLPDWSPDGKKIVVTECRSVRLQLIAEEDCALLIITPDNGGVHSLSSELQPWDVYARWTADGRLLFPSNRHCFESARITSCGGVYSLAPGASEAELLEPYDDWNGDGEMDVPWFVVPPSDASSTVMVPLVLGPDFSISEVWSWDLETGAKEKVSSSHTGPNLDWQPRCTVRGTKGPDTLRGTASRDLICGLGGEDRIDGLGGDDVIFGHGGDDEIDGGRGADIVVGNAGRDRCVGDRRDHSNVC